MLRVFEAFSGIGTQRMALRNLGIEHEVVCIAEIDKFAIRSYEAIHGETLNLGDVSKIDPNDIPDHDLFTYSFPCQDISIAGKGKGFEPESGTRSSLLWECEKIIEAKRPKYLLMENVKALIFKKFKLGFEKWLRLLEELGYTNYWQVLNAKDYGIPQNRERVFCVSILGTHEPYVFPKPIPLDKRLKDVLEDEVDEKFYINNEKADKPLQQLINKGQLEDRITTVDGTINEPRAKDVSNCIKARYDAGISNLRSDGTMVVEKPIGIKVIGQMDHTLDNTFESANRVYDKEGISPTVNTCGGGGLQPKIIVASRGRNPSNPSDRTTGSPTEQRLEPQYRIRKLTPKECWRLMGISDEDFEKAQEVNSNTQLYKQAGNAIVVDVLEGIFRKLFLSKSKEKENKLEEQLEWLDDLLGVGK